MAHIPTIPFNIPEAESTILGDEIPSHANVMLERDRFKTIEKARKIGGANEVSDELVVAKHFSDREEPAWATSFIARLNGRMDRLEGMLDEGLNELKDMFNTGVGQLNGRVDQLNGKMRQMEAMVECDRARVGNYYIRDHPMNLIPIVKYRSGHPFPIPPVLPNFIFTDGQYDVGTLPPNGLIPHTYDGLGSISNAKMDAIYWFYNDPNFAPDGRTLTARCIAFKRFVSLPF